MFNWNAQMQGSGYPMHPQQMMPFTGMQQSYPPPMPYQGTMAPQNWAQQQPPPAFQTMPPNALGMMMGQSWMPQAQGMYPTAGYPPDPMNMAGIMGGTTPMPPMQPPPEENPPLPAEPPPPLPNEKPPPPKDQPKPPPPGQSKSKWDQISREPSINASYKSSAASSQPPGPMMQNVSMSGQAHPAPPHFPPPNQPEPPPEPVVSKKPPPDPALMAELDKVTKEQEIFLEQYRQWKKQYDDWREQNQNHPNKDQFQQYLEQWQTYEQQMEVRRKSIETQKKSLEEKLTVTSFPASSAGTLQKPPEHKVTQDVKSSKWDNPKKEVSPASTGFFRPSSEREQMMRSNEQDSNVSKASSANKKIEGSEQGNFPGKLISGNIRDQVSSPSRQVKIPGIGDEDKGEEDMNLDDDENSVGGIIESREQAASKDWMTGGPAGPPGSTAGPSGSATGLSNSSSFQKNTNNWNSWNESEGSGQWGNEMNNFGPPGPDFQGGPRPDYWGGQRPGPNFHGGPKPGPDFTRAPKPGPNFQGGPRPGPNFQGGPRPGADFQGGPRPGADFQGGPRPGPDFQGGPRAGPDFQGGPRAGPDFQGGPRPGPDFQGGPRPGPDFQGPRPGPDFQGPRPGPDFQGGPKPGPDFQGGPRPGSNFQGGPRPGPDFQGGPRPGPDFQGGPRPGPDFQGGPRPGSDFQGPRPGTDFQGGPRPGPDFQGGPRPGPDFQGGPRSGPDFQGGPRPGPDFKGGPRSGPDFQGGPRPGPDFKGGPKSGPDFQGGPRSGPPEFQGGVTSTDTDFQGDADIQGGPRQGPEFYGRPRPGHDFEGGPRPGSNFYGGPRPGLRGRGDWNMRGNGPRFGRGGPGMNDGPRFPGPPNDNIDYQEDQVAGNEVDTNDTEFENDIDYPENQIYNGPVGRGNLRRGRGDFQRGRGDFQRGGISSDFPGGRGADFHRGRGSRGGRGEFHSGRGGEHPRGPGGMFGEGPGPNLFDVEEEAPSRDGQNFRGRGRGQPPPMRGKPPSLLEVNFHESMRERFPDFMDDDQPFSDGANLRDDDFRPMGRGRGFPEPHESAEMEGFGSHRGRGFPRGRGLLDRGRGMPRPRGGFNNEQQPFVEEPPEEFNYGPRGRGRGMPRGRGGGYGGDRFLDSEDIVEEMHHEGFNIRGRGRGAGRGSRGRGGFADSQNVDSLNDDTYGDGFPDEGPFNPRGRGGGAPYGRGRGRGMSTGPWSNEQEMEKPPPHLENEEIPEEGKSSVDLVPPRNNEPPRRGSFEGEPDAKKLRFEQEPPVDTDRRANMPYPPYPRDPFDPYMDPYADPYCRYPDPYFRDPYLDPPFGYDRMGYDRFGAFPPRFDPERKPFLPPESIDYGHGGAGKEKKSLQPAEVIDYGHGQAVDKKSSEPSMSGPERERPSGNKDVELGDPQRDRKMNRDGISEWSSGRDFRGADSRDSYNDRMSRDMDLRYRDMEGRPPGFEMRGFGGGREEGRLSGYKPGASAADEDMRRGHRPDVELDYKDRSAGEREDYYGARGRYGAREENRRGDFMGRGDDGRMEDLYRRDDPYVGSEYSRLRDDDVRGGRGFGRDAGLPPRDGISRDPYSRDDRDMYRGERDRLPRAPSPAPGTPPTSASLASATSEVVKIEDLLCPPQRLSRPPQIVIIIRGLPGSGKTYVSKLIREKETNYGGSAPRMLCLDDYFMVETDKEVTDPDTGKKVKKKVIEYEYEQALEEAYRQSLLKSFKKTVDDGFFPFIILDATNEKVAHFSEFWSYAKSKGFQVYVGELKVDVATCIQRNVHHWTEWDIEKVKTNWEPLPCHYIKLDLRWILQDASIPEVVMEDTETVAKEPEEKKEGEEDEEEEASKEEGIYVKSKWELDKSEETLDKLDGIRVSKKHILEHQSLNEYLGLDQMDDEYNSRESLPGKKRVRWADLEEKKNQNRRRNLGFIVGQTQQDWDRITDDDFATKALNQTKYFYKS